MDPGRSTRPPLSARGRRTGRRLAATLIVVLLAACSSYVQKSGEIREALLAEDYGRALSAVEEISQSNSKLLYLYEKGLVLHYQGQLDSSSRAFSQSELVLEDLYTRSITREAASLTVSETIAQYRGDAFEAVYVHYFQILNYLGMNDIDGAMVECRRVNRKLQMLSDGGETYFVNDPFLQYLTGLVYQMGGEREAAGVSYRVAAQLYADSTFDVATPVPPSFYADAAENAIARGDRDEADAYAARVAYTEGDGTGHVSLFIECGQVIRKREASLVLPIFESDRWNNNERFAQELSRRHGVNYGPQVRIKYWLKVALPALEPMPPRYTAVSLRVRSAEGAAAGEARAVVVSNLDAYAVQAYKEKESTMFVRAIVRALVKYLAHEEASQKDEGLGALVNILGIVTETADTRSWSSLPGCIFLGRLNLPPGRYQINADLLGPGGQAVGSIAFNDVSVVEGKHVVRSARAF